MIEADLMMPYAIGATPADAQAVRALGERAVSLIGEGAGAAALVQLAVLVSRDGAVSYDGHDWFWPTAAQVRDINEQFDIERPQHG